MTDRELMQMALDALEKHVLEYETAEALRARLAQPEPEPVAWMYQQEDTGVIMCAVVQQVGSGFEKNNPRWQKIGPLYTAPPQREWQGLTDEERTFIAWESNNGPECVAMTEAKLKEKNT
jgi:hypothetical protein